MTGETCPVCGESFSTAGGLREHAWDAHGACHYCGDQYDDIDALYTHWLLAHEGELSERDRERAHSVVDEPAMSDRVAEQGLRGAVGGLSRRALLLGGGTVLAGGATVGGLALLDNSGGSTASEEIQIPSSPGDYRYAVAGTGDATASITYFGNWKCPYCARFSSGFFSTLVEEYVEPGDLRIEFRNLAYFNGEPFLGADSPDAGRAGLAVWNDDPDSYWAFHHHVFGNQPPEGDNWATASRLTTMAEEAGVSDPAVVREAIEEGQYQDALDATASAATDAGINGVPALLIDGEVVSALAEDEVRTRVDTLVE